MTTNEDRLEIQNTLDWLREWHGEVEKDTSLYYKLDQAIYAFENLRREVKA